MKSETMIRAAGSAFDAVLATVSHQFTRQDDLSSWTPAGQHNRRVKSLILSGGLLCAVIGIIWAEVYLMRGNLVGVWISLTVMVAGVIMLSLGWRNQVRIAAISMAHLLLFAVILSCLAEIPPEGVARSAHMNLLPVAAATFLVFDRDSPYLRFVLPVTALIAFLAFGLDILPPWMALSGSGADAGAGVWANTLSGILGLCLVIFVMQANVNARRAMESDIRRAIAKGEFHLHYQPQVDGHGRMVGAEALLRWRHPVRGAISPQEFIPLAEETGLIIPIGEWVLRMACAQLLHWQSAPHTAHLTISVNVSASQFRQPDFVEHVRAIVTLGGAGARQLKLELTESALAEDVATVTEKMRALTDIGVTWSLDDFGTGYSSLATLKHLPFDQVKIDQSFVRDLLCDKRNMAIVETILRLSESLGMAVIAEGVETDEQLAALRAAGCQSFQGYLFSRPLPVAELENFIRTAA